MEEISGNVVEVGRKSDRVVAVALTLGREVIRIICAYRCQSRRLDKEKVRFFHEIESESEWDLASCSEILMYLWDFCWRVKKCAEAFKGVRIG